MKRIYSIILMYMFIICSSTVSFATPTDDLDKLTFSAEVFVRDVNFSESGDERNASFDNVSISLNDGIQVSGTLTYFDEQEDLTLQGDIYLHDDGYNSGKLILGDLYCENEQFEVMNFKIYTETVEKKLLTSNKQFVDTPSMTIILKDINTDEYLALQALIDGKDISKYISKAEKSLTKLKSQNSDYRGKMIKLYQLADNNRSENSTKHHTSQIFTDSTSADGQTNSSSISYSNIRELMDALHQDGYAYLDDYNISPSLFTDTGWDDYHYNGNSHNYFYHKFSKYNGSDEYLMQITLFDIDRTNNEYDDQWRYGVELEYRDGFQLQYDSSTDKVSVIYYDWGMKFYDIKIAVGDLTGPSGSFIHTRDINYSMSATSNGVYGLIGLVLPNGIIGDVWEVVTSDFVDKYTRGSSELFGGTISDQEDKYNGKVVKNTQFDSGSAYMYDEGDFASLVVTCTLTGQCNIYYAYSYSCDHNL